MRRALATLTTLALVALAPVALGVSGSENYKDTFSSGGYSGNDGSLLWNGSWKEVGESNGPSTGKVRVDDNGHCAGNRCLVIGDGGLLTAGEGASRLADLSMFEKAKLSYAVGFDPGTDLLLGLATAELVVEVSIDGGLSWVIVDVVGLETEKEATARSLDVSSFISSKFGVRFTVTGALGTEVSVDNVEIAGKLPEPTTTTTKATTTTTTTTSTTTTTLISLPPTTLPDLGLTTTTTTTTAPSGTPTTTPTSTTTTESSGTSTTLLAAGPGGPVDPGEPGDDEGPDGADDSSSRLRQPSIGLESDFETGLFGSTPEVLGFQIDTGFTNVVELVEAGWYWVFALAVLITFALIKGIDYRLGVVHRPE